MPSSDYIRTFDSRSMDDVPRVGGKTASLGELYNLLKGAPVSVPAGFAVTAQAYRDALTDACAWAQLSALMEGFDIADVVGGSMDAFLVDLLLRLNAAADEVARSNEWAREGGAVLLLEF